MMGIDPAKPLAEPVLNGGGLRTLRCGHLDHECARRRFASTAVTLRRMPATPGRSNGVSPKRRWNDSGFPSSNAVRSGSTTSERPTRDDELGVRSDVVVARRARELHVPRTDVLT